MPYNYLGNLYKGEIVCRFLEHCGNHWLTTEFGVKYTIYRGPVFDADAWHPSVIADISKYLDKNS